MRLLEGLVEGVVKCRQVDLSRYESTLHDVRNGRVDKVRLSIRVLEGVVDGVCNMSSSRFESPRLDFLEYIYSQVDKMRISEKVP